MNNNEEKIRYERNKEWYNIKEIGSLFQIKNTICKKRLGLNKFLLIEGETLKLLKSKRGKKTHLYHYSILNDIFGVRNKPKDIKEKRVRVNYIGTTKWDYIGFITPQRSTLTDLKYKMKYLHDNLILTYGKKSGIKLFYSLEPNPNDKYYHSHFLIDCTKDILELSEIENKLKIICEQNTSKDSRIHIEKYDTNYGKDGAIYSSKEIRYFYEVLG